MIINVSAYRKETVNSINNDYAFMMMQHNKNLNILAVLIL
jgi:hypothetical protein